MKILIFYNKQLRYNYFLNIYKDYNNLLYMLITDRINELRYRIRYNRYKY